MKNKYYILEYFKLVLFRGILTWINTIIGVIGTLSYLSISVFSDENKYIKIQEFFVEYLYKMFPWLLVIFSFLAWRELKKKLENEVDYEITYKIEDLSKIDFRKDADKVDKIIKDYESQNELERMSDRINSIGMFSNSIEDKYFKIENYAKEIEEYKKFVNDNDIFHIHFFIKNIGIKSDEKINCKILNLENKRIIKDKKDIYRLAYEKPKFPNFNEGLFLNCNISKNNNYPFRKKIGDFHFELAYLNAKDDPVEIFFKNENVFIEGNKDIFFIFQITSKNLKNSIKKEIKVEFPK